MMKICVVTGTRAEYGLLFHVLKGIKKAKNKTSINCNWLSFK